jgi:alkylated DNA nucleotide flippase Atl1
MHEQIYEKLQEVARRGTVTYYSDIAPMAGLDMDLPNDR